MGAEKTDIGKEIAKVHPLILREAVKRQMNIMPGEQISISHIAILDLLTEKGPLRMGDLAAALNLTMGAVTGIVDKMIAFKLVKRERDEKDRRVVRVFLLSKGNDIVDRLDKQKSEMVNDIFSVFTAAEKTEYLRLLRKVYDKLRSKDE